jgi:hypothetical protein
MLWAWAWGANFAPLSKRVRMTYNAIALCLLIIGLLIGASEHPAWAWPFLVSSAATSYVKAVHAAQRRRADNVSVAR